MSQVRHDKEVLHLMPLDYLSLPVSASGEDTMPEPIFVFFHCNQCNNKFAAVRDPTTGNMLYFDGRYVPQWPPLFTVSGNNIQDCPQCLTEMKLVSVAATVTRDGGWIRLDTHGAKIQQG